MAVDPQIVLAESKFRESLGAGDANSRKAVLKAYSGSFRAVTEDLNRITATIDAARKAGEQVSASWLMQQSRYRDLQTQTAQMVRSMTVALGTALPQDQLAMAKAAEQMVGVASGPIFNKLPAAAVEGVIGTTTSGSPLRALLDSFNTGATDKASRFIRSRLIAGIALGRPSRQIAAQIAGGVESLTLSRAMTISRTETQRAFRRATTLSIAANLDLIAGWVWRSAANERTCAACFSLHGTFFPGSTPMRAHPNCRCVMIPKRKVKDDPYGFGNAVKVGNGKELFDALPIAAQRRILGPGRLELYQQGKVPFSGMRSLRNNPMWGPSYQVRSLRDIKGDLDKPPPLPKPPKPTGAPPSIPMADPVPGDLPSPPVSPVAAPVAPKASLLDKQRQKIAANEGRLLEIAEAEKRFESSLPTLTDTEALAWKRGELLPDVHMAKMRVITDTDSVYAMSREARDAIASSYYADARGLFFGSAQRRFLLPDGRYQWDFTMFRTTRKVKYPGYGPSFTNPDFRASVFRALPSRTDDMALILRRTAVEKALADAKIAMERMLDSASHPVRVVARAAPKEMTAADLQAAQLEAGTAQATVIRQLNDKFDTLADFDRSPNTIGLITNKEALKIGNPNDPLLTYGYQLRGDYLLSRSYQMSADQYPMYEITKLRPGSASPIGYHLSRGGSLDRFDEMWMQHVAGLSDDLIRAIKAQTQAYQDYSAWHEYSLVRGIAGKNKPIGEIPIGVSGVSVPIPSSSSFAGKPRKWTTRDDDNPARAKDQVAYQIADRLAQDSAFIRSMAENDALGEWIIGAGRGARPAVADVAPKWRGMTVSEREAFLRSGVREQGYYDWKVSTSRIYNDAGEALDTTRVIRGTWHPARATEGQDFIYDYSSQMVQQWAATSGDAHILSVGLQRAAMDEFSLQSSTTLAHFEGRSHSGGYGVDPMPGDLLGASQIFYEANGDSLRRFLRAMYDNTQEELAWAGISTVRAIRGVNSVPRATAEFWVQEQAKSGSVRSAYDFPHGVDFAGPVDLQPMSSFAVDTKTATNFGSNLIYVDVPASWVIGTARTGFGCLNEFEWVLLGGPMQATVKRKGY